MTGLRWYTPGALCPQSESIHPSILEGYRPTKLNEITRNYGALSISVPHKLRQHRKHIMKMDLQR